MNEQSSQEIAIIGKFQRDGYVLYKREEKRWKKSSHNINAINMGGFVLQME